MAVRPQGRNLRAKILKFKNSDVQETPVAGDSMSPLLPRFRSLVFTKGDEGEWVRQYYLRLLT
jgi:hypothetical protein